MISTSPCRAAWPIATCLSFLFPVAAHVRTLTQTPSQPLLNFKSWLGGSEKKVAKFASEKGNLLYLGAVTLLPLLGNGAKNKQRALHTADLPFTFTLITKGLKRCVREKQPDFSDRHSTRGFVAGTAVSYQIPRFELFLPQSLSLPSLISPHRQGDGNGVTLSRTS